MKYSFPVVSGFARLAPLLLMIAGLHLQAAQPSIGQKALDFRLPMIHGESLHLSEELSKGSVALIVLRGYPGYQCPFCNRQAQDLIANASAFAELGVRVVMVYPGPEKDLALRAEEFMKGKTLPANFRLALDPGYAFTNLYGLRWEAPSETAYPSTFLIDKDGTIFFALISTQHGGRSKASDLLDQLKKKASGK